MALTSIKLHEQAARFTRKIPDIVPGYTVRVHEKIQEGGKERIQMFEGLVISVHKGHVATDRSFTVRKVVSGIGVEKVFPMHSPAIAKIEVKKVAESRRAKLYYLRGRTGKSARLNERFTNEGEFDVKEDPVVAAEPEVAAEAAPEAAAPEVAAEAAPAAEQAPETPAA